MPRCSFCCGERSVVDVAVVTVVVAGVAVVTVVAAAVAVAHSPIDFEWMRA